MDLTSFHFKTNKTYQENCEYKLKNSDTYTCDICKTTISSRKPYCIKKHEESNKHKRYVLQFYKTRIAEANLA